MKTNAEWQQEFRVAILAKPADESFSAEDFATGALSTLASKELNKLYQSTFVDGRSINGRYLSRRARNGKHVYEWMVE